MQSHPTVGVVRFGSNVSERLISSREELPVLYTECDPQTLRSCSCKLYFSEYHTRMHKHQATTPHGFMLRHLQSRNRHRIAQPRSHNHHPYSMRLRGLAIAHLSRVNNKAVLVRQGN